MSKRGSRREVIVAIGAKRHHCFPYQTVEFPEIKLVNQKEKNP
jgi:hypothetical protein